MSQQQQQQKSVVASLAPIIAGGIAGQASLLAVQPMDFVRTRLQTTAKSEYSGVIDCFAKTLKNDGIKTFYRGMFVPFLAQGVYKAVMFSSFEFSSSYFKNRQNNSITPVQLAFCGGSAGVLNSVVVTPVEMIRNNLMVQRKAASGANVSLGDVIKSIYAQNGLRSFWKGQSATSLRDFFGVGAYFFANNRMNAFLNQNTDLSTPAKQILAGMSAGVSFWLLATPIDRLKSIIQTSGANNMVEVAKVIIQKEGLTGLYRGFPAGALRGIPAAAITFYVYNSVFAALQKM